MKHTVTYNGPNPREAIQGLGSFERGAARDVLLTDAQAASLRAKGWSVEAPVSPPPEPSPPPELVEVGAPFDEPVIVPDPDPKPEPYQFKPATPARSRRRKEA